METVSIMLQHCGKLRQLTTLTMYKFGTDNILKQSTFRRGERYLLERLYLGNSFNLACKNIKHVREKAYVSGVTNVEDRLLVDIMLVWITYLGA